MKSHLTATSLILAMALPVSTAEGGARRYGPAVRSKFFHLTPALKSAP